MLYILALVFADNIFKDYNILNKVFEFKPLLN